MVAFQIKNFGSRNGHEPGPIGIPKRVNAQEMFHKHGATFLECCEQMMTQVKCAPESSGFLKQWCTSMHGHQPSILSWLNVSPETRNNETDQIKVTLLLSLSVTAFAVKQFRFDN